MASYKYKRAGPQWGGQIQDIPLNLVSEVNDVFNNKTLPSFLEGTNSNGNGNIMYFGVPFALP